ncbi:MAG TPA: glycoside hydrolase family 3 N-terminal domain-containing protein [Acidobacteriota bacterium]|nr:glycoside hydrolase family 3 N-terminal domain-containing protein [Acidobacteriota bacterium]
MAAPGPCQIASPLVFSYPELRPDPELLAWIEAGLVAGVVIFGANAPDDDILTEAVRTLRRHAGERPFRVMIDEEGGDVRRLQETDRSMRPLRHYRTEGPAAAAQAYVGVARRLKAIGIDTLLAPVVDVSGPDAAWLGMRTYSDDPDEVAHMARAVITAVQNEGIDCCAKHFPGTRGVARDTHLGAAEDPTPLTDWERLDAPPFRAAITAGVRAVMVGHQKLLGFDAIRPACLSPLIVSVLLRERLGFIGCILTDDLAMGAVAGHYPIESAVEAALVAGCNQVLICHDRVLQRRAVTLWQEMCRRNAGTAPS